LQETASSCYSLNLTSIKNNALLTGKLAKNYHIFNFISINQTRNGAKIRQGTDDIFWDGKETLNNSHFIKNLNVMNAEKFNKKTN
jgi:hypothetical protein